MDGISISFRSRIKGDISDGKMQQDAKDYEHDVAKAIADEAHDIWVRNLVSSIRHPTPYYWTRIDTRELSPTRYRIHDHGIVYGPWLEGTGSRNAPVTVFPGYHALRRAQEEIAGKRGSIARRILRRYRSEGKLV